MPSFIPIAVDFFATRFTYQAALNSMVAGINELYSFAQTLQVGRQAVGSSVTSRTIGAGSVAFVIAESDRSWTVGTPLMIASSASPTNFMRGQITAYDPVTKIVTVSVSAINGSGTFAAWSLGPDPTGGQVALSTTNRGTIPAARYVYIDAAGNVTGVELPDSAVAAIYSQSQFNGGM